VENAFLHALQPWMQTERLLPSSSPLLPKLREAWVKESIELTAQRFYIVNSNHKMLHLGKKIRIQKVHTVEKMQKYKELKSKFKMQRAQELAAANMNFLLGC
jgi:hypothetical protein